MIRRPPRSTRTDTLFPYTTLFRSCRDLGIETVVVHSDADAEMPFVQAADAAVRLRGNSPAETYLRADPVLEPARRTGADAIHPGYGFLSETADFPRPVLAPGLTWVAPAPDRQSVV